MAGISGVLAWGLLLPSALFDDDGVASDADGIDGFGRPRDAAVGNRGMKIQLDEWGLISHTQVLKNV